MREVLIFGGIVIRITNTPRVDTSNIDKERTMAVRVKDER